MLRFALRSKPAAPAAAAPPPAPAEAPAPQETVPDDIARLTAALQSVLDGQLTAAVPPMRDPRVAPLAARATALIARLAETQKLLDLQTFSEGLAERRRREEARGAGEVFNDTVARALRRIEEISAHCVRSTEAATGAIDEMSARTAEIDGAARRVADMTASASRLVEEVATSSDKAADTASDLTGAANRINQVTEPVSYTHLTLPTKA
jgi:methyl-accepting chemotaxis protein